MNQLMSDARARVHERRPRDPDRIAAALLLVDQHARHVRVVDRLLARHLARHEGERVGVGAVRHRCASARRCLACRLPCRRRRRRSPFLRRRPSRTQSAPSRSSTMPAVHARLARREPLRPSSRTNVGRFVVEKKPSGRTPSAGAGREPGVGEGRERRLGEVGRREVSTRTGMSRVGTSDCRVDGSWTAGRPDGWTGPLSSCRAVELSSHLQPSHRPPQTNPIPKPNPKPLACSVSASGWSNDPTA